MLIYRRLHHLTVGSLEFFKAEERAGVLSLLYLTICSCTGNHFVTKFSNWRWLLRDDGEHASCTCEEREAKFWMTHINVVIIELGFPSRRRLRHWSVHAEMTGQL